MSQPTTLHELSPADLRRRCAEGLAIGVGPFVICLHSRAPLLAESLQRYYPHAPLAPAHEFADAVITLQPPAARLWPGARRWALTLEDGQPFTEFPASALLAHLEWTINWCIASRAHHYLMLHAAVLERGGLALVMPGQPGAGKSTLCAWLMHHGWRLLSDEFGLLRPQDLRLAALPRPIPLKNDSIGVIAGACPTARFGPSIEGTRKGTVAHLLPPAVHLQRMQETARPRWVVFPQYGADLAADLHALHPAECFAALTQHAFNYALLGATGFETVAALTGAVDAWRLRYASLPDAARLIDQLCGLRAAA
jgi:HprK-related kinase A